MDRIAHIDAELTQLAIDLEHLELDAYDEACIEAYIGELREERWGLLECEADLRDERARARLPEDAAALDPNYDEDCPF